MKTISGLHQTHTSREASYQIFQRKKTIRSQLSNVQEIKNYSVGFIYFEVVGPSKVIAFVNKLFSLGRKGKR